MKAPRIVTDFMDSPLITSNHRLAITTADDVDNMRHNPLFLQKLRDFSIAQYLKYNEYGHYSNIRTFFVNVQIFFTNGYSRNAFSDISPGVIDIMLSHGTDGLLYHTLASKYISDVLVHFTEFDERDRIVRFNYVAYFTKVYIFNCDLWGLLFCYNVFFLFQDKYKYEEYIEIEPSVYSSFLYSLLSMYMGEVMINGHKKINVYKIIKLLKNLIN